MLVEAVRIMERPRTEEGEAQLLDLIQDLDLFLFREIKVRNGRETRKSNIFLESLHRGFEKVVDHLLAEGFSNIRSSLKLNNHLEIDNEVALFDVSFFIAQMKD
jgi:hypothetical protein